MCACLCAVCTCVHAGMHACVRDVSCVSTRGVGLEKSPSVEICLQLPGDGKDLKQQIKQIGHHSQIDLSSAHSLVMLEQS